MATTEVGRTRVAWYVLAGVGTVVAIALAIGYFTRPPQMGTDEDAFKTVDALYTAIGMKDESKVAQCERRLQKYRDAGKLPAASAAFLDRVIATARSGQWESAQRELYDFMLAQRRDGRK